METVFGTANTFDRFEEGNPAGPPIRMVGELDGRIVGFNQWLAWELPGLALGTVYQSGASAVHPDARGLGLFGKLLTAGEAVASELQVGCFIGFPNPASTPAFLKHGWEIVTSLSLQVALAPGTAIAPLSDGLPDTVEAFPRWRYGLGGVSSVQLRAGGGRMVVRGVRTRPRVYRMLDVVDSLGRRELARLATASAALPIGSIGIARFPGSGWRRGFVTIPRSWETPVIVKAITAPSSSATMFAEFDFMYGDIDVG